MEKAKILVVEDEAIIAMELVMNQNRDKHKTRSQLLLELERLRQLVSAMQGAERIGIPEEKLLPSREDFKVVAETSQTALMVHDGTMWSYVNPATVDFFGYSQEEFLNTPFRDYAHPDDAEMVQERAQIRVKSLCYCRSTRDMPFSPYKMMEQNFLNQYHLKIRQVDLGLNLCPCL